MILQQLKFPAVICFIVLSVMLFEVFQRGYKGSSIDRLLSLDKSSIEDAWWFIANISGLMRIATIILSFGIAYWLPALLHWKQPVCNWPFGFQLLFTGFTNEFIFYWTHRFMHRYLWKIHSVHHSATAFNGITVFRTHPIEVTLSSPLLSLPAALLGVNPTVIAVWTLLRMLHDILIHTNIEWSTPWISEWILIDGKHHAQHHSNIKENYDCKFATIPIFDKIFGTWKPLPSEPITIGI